MQSFSVLGVRIDQLENEELSELLKKIHGLIITPNPEIILAAIRDERYRKVLNDAVLALPDGIALKFAVSALYDGASLSRHTGIDTFPEVASIAEDLSETLVIFGGHADDHEKVKSVLLQSHPRLRVVCIDPGIISDNATEISEQWIDSIASLGPCVVVVALGQGIGAHQGKQERVAEFILSHAFNVRFAIGLGGTIDVIAGRIKRAPSIFQRFGVEWVWRLLCNPWRLPRILRAVIVFPVCIAWDTLRRGRFIRACRCVLSSLFSHFFKAL